MNAAPIAKPRVHGLVKGTHGDALRLPMLRVMWSIQEWYPAAYQRDASLPAPWISPFVLDSMEKLKDVWWKLNRASDKLGQLAPSLSRLGRAVAPPIENLWDIEDFEMYLDMLVTYLRVQADCIAGLFASLYGERAKKASIAWESFRKHIVWFSKTSPAFDPGYAEVVRRHSGWFHKLATADRPGWGLRDGIIHGMARYQFQISDGVGPPSIGLTRRPDKKIEDVPGEIRNIVDGLTLYLDATYEVFLGRMGHAIDPRHRHGFEAAFHFRASSSHLPDVEQHPGRWMYPLIEQ